MDDQTTTLSEPRIVTIRDVALAAGVDKSTVSYALSGKRRVGRKTKADVLAAARQLGYRPNPHAQRLSQGGCPNMVGLFTLGLDLGVGTLKAQLIQQLLSERGFDAPLYSYAAFGGGETVRQAELLGALCSQRPQAIVYAHVGLDEATAGEVSGCLERYQAHGGTVVAYGSEAGFKGDYVLFDSGHNTYLAVKHLLDLGHEAIGFYVHGPSSVGHRVTGARRAMAEAGLELKPEWLFHGGLYAEGGALLAEKFLSLRERPTAMCITNEMSAAMFVSRVQLAGLGVPEDVSVVSHDDTPVASCCAVPLTTMTQPVEQIARALVDLLCSRLDGSYDGVHRRVAVCGELVVRQSAAPKTPPPTPPRSGEGSLLGGWFAAQVGDF